MPEGTGESAFDASTLTAPTVVKCPSGYKSGEPSDFFVVDVNDPEQGAAKVIEIVRDRIPRRFGLDPLLDLQVPCPMQRGPLGARALNADLQEALNPDPPARIAKFGSTFAPGDKVMQTENDYDREGFNGDVGSVVRIDEDEGVVHVGFDGREVAYPFAELDALVPALRHDGAQVASAPNTRPSHSPLRRNIIPCDSSMSS